MTWFHSWRAAAAEAFYRRSGDVRHVATQMGHALAATTVGSYLHTLDLQSVPLLQTWPSPLNRRDLHLPVVVLAALLGRTSRRVMQMVKEFNEAHPNQPVSPVGPEKLPDGPRPARPSKSMRCLTRTPTGGQMPTRGARSGPSSIKPSCRCLARINHRKSQTP